MIPNQDANQQAIEQTLMCGDCVPHITEKTLRKLNVPWITKEGYLDLTKVPIDDTLSRALSDDPEEFADACRVLSSVALAGRTEAGVFLCGLLGHYANSAGRKEKIVEALACISTQQVAGLLFAELESTDSSNATRGYISLILKALGRFPLPSVEKGFQRLLSDSKWTYRMKRKFREILDEIECRDRQFASLKSQP